MKESVASLTSRLVTAAWWKPGLEVLDFGCGTGKLLESLVEQGKVASCVGADVEDGMLNVFRRKVQQGRFGQVPVEVVKLTSGDAQELEEEETLKKGGFDLVTTTYVLGHVRDKDVTVVVQRLAQSVKPGQGRLFIVEWENFGENALQHQHGHSQHGHAHHGHSHKSNEHVNDGGHGHTCVKGAQVAEQLKTLGFDIQVLEVFDANVFPGVDSFALVARRKHDDE